LPVAMIVIIGDVSGVAVPDLAWRVRVGIPDRRTLAVRVPCAFDLVGRGRGAPVEPLRELPRCRRRLRCFSAFRLKRRMEAQCGTAGEQPELPSVQSDAHDHCLPSYRDGATGRAAGCETGATNWETAVSARAAIAAGIFRGGGPDLNWTLVPRV